jgi:hypothetical protein
VDDLGVGRNRGISSTFRAHKKVEGTMNHGANTFVEHLPPELLARDMYEIEMYFREEGHSEFVYDEELDIFRFPEDGRFAFCKEVADWERLWQRGYLTF